MSRMAIRFVLTIAALGIGTAFVFMIATGKSQGADRDILFTALGVVLGWGTGALNYWFGTSESSAQKTDAMGIKAANEKLNEEIEP